MERNFELLKKVLSVPTKTYQEDLMIEFIVDWLESKNIPFYLDQYYNVYATKQTDDMHAHLPSISPRTGPRPQPSDQN